jgi:hypothetical protein
MTLRSHHTAIMLEKYPFEILIEGPISNVSEPQIQVIKEKEGLSKIVNQLNKSRSPKIPVPAVDFKKETIIGLFMGEKTTGGYGISVASIQETKNELIVQVAESGPKGKFVSMVITQPFSIFKIKKTDKAIRFEKIEH